MASLIRIAAVDELKLLSASRSKMDFYQRLLDTTL